jgi:hypothetical protein
MQGQHPVFPKPNFRDAQRLINRQFADAAARKNDLNRQIGYRFTIAQTIGFICLGRRFTRLFLGHGTRGGERYLLLGQQKIRQHPADGAGKGFVQQCRHKDLDRAIPVKQSQARVLLTALLNQLEMGPIPA